MLYRFFVSLIVILISTNAYAGCFFGQKNLPGSLGPGQNDSTRSFTVNRSALFVVQTNRGRPITANLGCGWGTSTYHACRVYTNSSRHEINVQLANNFGRQITYRWICQH